MRQEEKNVPVKPMDKNTKSTKPVKRKLNPSDIKIPEGYRADVFAEGLTTPICMIISENDEIYIADSGITSGNGKVLKYSSGKFKVIADGFNPPLTGINYRDGNIYVSHRGIITLLKPDGSREDIITGLPSYGDHHNNKVVFGPDNKMYFGQGTATNSGVVGADNEDWVKKYPFFHDYPGLPIALNGFNFKTKNFLTASKSDLAYTGAFSAFGIPSSPGEVIKGQIKASGSILRADLDGSNLELVAFGLRNPFRIRFDRNGLLYCANHGMDVRGSRPVENSPDEFQLILPGAWYGWPDYTGGLPLTLPMFKPEGKPQPEFLLAYHPMVPPRPVAAFADHSAIMGFDFNYTDRFDGSGDAYIAEFGSEAPETTGGKPLPGVGHRVSRINVQTGKITTFAINKSGYAASYTGGGGFERPIDALFSKDGSLYVVDFGLNGDDVDEYIPGTGVIWRITKV